MRRVAVFAVILGLAVLVLGMQFLPNVSAQSGQDQGNGFTIIDRDAVAYGRTYSEWNAAWEQWADSIPTANHPLFDNGNCSVGQSGPVWFLGGKFIAIGGSGSYTGVVRNCNVHSERRSMSPFSTRRIPCLRRPPYLPTSHRSGNCGPPLQPEWTLQRA